MNARHRAVVTRRKQSVRLYAAWHTCAPGKHGKPTHNYTQGYTHKNICTWSYTEDGCRSKHWPTPRVDTTGCRQNIPHRGSCFSCFGGMIRTWNNKKNFAPLAALGPREITSGRNFTMNRSPRPTRSRVPVTEPLFPANFAQQQSAGRVAPAQTIRIRSPGLRWGPSAATRPHPNGIHRR